MVVGYSSSRASNNWLKVKMERGVAAGMKRGEGIVFNEGSTEWASYPTTICDDCGREACLWLSSKEEMILYNESLPEDTESNGRRRMIYHQMAFKPSR
jgi:hypothetical protein